MSAFDTDPVELQLTGARLRHISADAHEALAPLRADVASLLGGAWSGGAASRFAAGWEQWHAAAVDALRVLAELGEAVSHSGRSYQDSDALASRTVASAGASR